MPKLKIKRGDNVVVISGRDKGKQGKVLRVFPAEARAIHYGEREKRGIYGEATSKDVEELAEEGIGVTSIPWVPRQDS